MIYTLGDFPILAHLMDQRFKKKSSLLSKRSTPELKPKQHRQLTVPVLFSSLFLCWPWRGTHEGAIGCCSFRPGCVSPLRFLTPNATALWYAATIAPTDIIVQKTAVASQYRRKAAASVAYGLPANTCRHPPRYPKRAARYIFLLLLISFPS